MEPNVQHRPYISSAATKQFGVVGYFCCCLTRQNVNHQKAPVDKKNLTAAPMPTAISYCSWPHTLNYETFVSSTAAQVVLERNKKSGQEPTIVVQSRHTSGLPTLSPFPTHSPCELVQWSSAKSRPRCLQHISASGKESYMATLNGNMQPLVTCELLSIGRKYCPLDPDIWGTLHHFGYLVHLVWHWHLLRNLSIRLDLQTAPMACAPDSSNNKNSWLMLTEKVKKMKISRTPASWEAHAWSIGREDPRRAIHALKVGTALTLVSLLYILEPLFKGVGKNAMWAVMTVVVVLEFTAGATVCKGLNRGLGTVMAGSLAFIIELVAIRSGKVFRGLFVGSSVFLIGFAATYLRFFPSIKKNYDYGVVIFLLTFNLITVSSFRQEDVLPLARDRLSTIAIGCAICLFMSLLVLPNWSGEDLHSCTVRKFEGLARSIEACVNEYFQDQDKDDNILDKQASRASIHTGYRAVLDSKSSDETLAHYASWEPRHSMHCYSYPWQKYVKLGSVLRHFAYTVAALHGCLESEIQTPPSVRLLFRNPCTRVAREVTKVLQGLAISIRDHHQCAPDVLSDHLHEALQDLNSAIRSQPRLFLGSKHACANSHVLMELNSGKHMSSRTTLPSFKTDTTSLLERKNTKADQPSKCNERSTLRRTLSKIAMTSLEFSEALPFAAFASLLVEMVVRLELVIEEVKGLEKAANFREFTGHDHLTIDLTCKEKTRNTNGVPLDSHTVSTAAE